MLSTRKRFAVAAGALFALAAAGAALTYRSQAGLVGTSLAADSAEAPAPEVPAPEVDVATVVARPITEWQNYSGRLEAVDKVEVRPLVPGMIVAVHLKDGAFVNKGDPLFTIDPRPYAAEVDRAAAQLAAAEARLAYTASEAARADRLVTSSTISKRDHDERQNAFREAAANLKAAKAALDAAKVSLAYTDVVAPVAGRVSRAELTVGNVVAAGAGAPVLTTVVSVSPIYASFNVDEQTYLRYLNRHSGTVPVALGLADEDGYSRNGTVVTVDNQLDVRSGTIRVRARFDNADRSLVPGLFARVKVGGGRPGPAVLVDDGAIGTDQAKKFVLVVTPENRVQYREITLGNLHDGLRVVAGGLQPGERIVVNGLQRVRPHDAVRVRSVDMTEVATRSARPATSL